MRPAGAVREFGCGPVSLKKKVKNKNFEVYFCLICRGDWEAAGNKAKCLLNICHFSCCSYKLQRFTYDFTKCANETNALLHSVRKGVIYFAFCNPKLEQNKETQEASFKRNIFYQFLTSKSRTFWTAIRKYYILHCIILYHLTLQRSDHVQVAKLENL